MKEYIRAPGDVSSVQQRMRYCMLSVSIIQIVSRYILYVKCLNTPFFLKVYSFADEEQGLIGKENVQENGIEGCRTLFL